MNQENEKAEITLNENGSGLNKKSWEETTSDDECEEEVSFRLKKRKIRFSWLFILSLIHNSIVKI